MATVQVIQRNAHLATSVRLEVVNGREGKLTKGTLTAISNSRRGPAEAREEESTAIQWTLWGAQAENAAAYLGKGSHVNLVGRLRNNNHNDGNGKDIYAMAFTCEEIDYLDSKADGDARRARQEGSPAPQSPSAATTTPAKANGRARKARTEGQGESVPA